MTKKKPKEKLTNKDLKELMGVNRPTYGHGNGGAIKQKGRFHE